MARRKTRQLREFPDTTSGERRDATRRSVTDPAEESPGPADTLRALQRQLGNRATARLLGVDGQPAAPIEAEAAHDVGTHRQTSAASDVPQLATIARKLHPGHGAPGNHVVQRLIKFDNAEVDLPAMIEAADDIDELVVLLNWGLTDTVHNFETTKRQTAAKAFAQALAEAKGQVEEPPALFRAANLKFLTKASGRLPTLYFASGGDSGRIRQQHGSGPAVITESGKVDYFFADKKVMSYFNSRVYDWGNKARIERRLVKYGGTTTPTAGYAHLEVTYAGDKPVKRHPSGGTIDVDLTGYDDAKIKAIYQQAIGVAL